MMIDRARQVPSPSAAAWLFRLTAHEGPSVLVLRQHEDEAAACLIQHLIALGVAHDQQHATALVQAAPVEHAGVLW